MKHGIPVALSTENGKETDSPLGPPEGTQPSSTVIIGL